MDQHEQIRQQVISLTNIQVQLREMVRQLSAFGFGRTPEQQQLRNDVVYFLAQQSGIPFGNSGGAPQSRAIDHHYHATYVPPATTPTPSISLRGVLQEFLQGSGLHGQTRTIPTSAQIQNATRHHLNDSDHSLTCPISFESLDGVLVSQIVGCGHQFSPTALMQWFKTNSTCPVCRFDICTPVAAPAPVSAFASASAPVSAPVSAPAPVAAPALAPAPANNSINDTNVLDTFVQVFGSNPSLSSVVRNADTNQIDQVVVDINDQDFADAIMRMLRDSLE